MKVPFFDLKNQYQELKADLEPEILKVMESCAYIGGSTVAEFEKHVADYLGCEYAMGCASGTDALVLALRACGIKPGDEVITTPFTFFATAEAIASIGAVPVFTDIKEDDYTMDPAGIEAALTERTKAILPVHIFGAAADMDAILDIAKRHQLRVIEDTAQGIGGEYKGKKLGTIGDVGCFSFYPTKNLGGCGDGGMVVTNEEHLSTILRALHEHGAGMQGAKAKEYLEGTEESLNLSEKADGLYNPYKYYNYLIGYNSRLDAVQARILDIKLRRLDGYNARRTAIAKTYRDGLTSKVILPSYNDTMVPCWHQFVLRTEYKQELCDYLQEHEIGCGTFYPVPLHKQKAFNISNARNTEVSLPVAELISSQSVCLPIYPELTDQQVQLVIDTVNRFYQEKAV